MSQDLTREMVLTEPAGTRMDLWVAQRIMGAGKPEYSTDIADAWNVVEEMQRRGRKLTLNDARTHPITYEIQAGAGTQAFCAFSEECGHPFAFAFGDTVPHAICRAALLTTIPLPDKPLPQKLVRE